jgi:hypothetical protein
MPRSTFVLEEYFFAYACVEKRYIEAMVLYEGSGYKKTENLKIAPWAQPSFEERTFTDSTFAYDISWEPTMWDMTL